MTTLVSNHTYAGLVLRPPGVAATGAPPDEPAYAALGERLAAPNGYASVPSHRLYPTTGTTEDWSYWTAGALSFTFEIGRDSFHPPFAQAVVDEYLGRGTATGADRGGNREAYLTLMEATADERLHGVLLGHAPAGATLRLGKRFATSTWPVWADDAGADTGEPLLVDDTLGSELVVADDGAVEWHVNPSTRPWTVGRHGRDPLAPPQPTVALDNPAGYPEPSVEGRSFEEVGVDVQGPPTADNGRLSVRIAWSDAGDDWDLYVLDPRGRVIAESAASAGTAEEAEVVDPVPGRHAVRVVNYAASGRSDWTGEARFDGPAPSTAGARERWTLTCELPGGESRPAREIEVMRGERVDLGDACAAPASVASANGPE